MDTQKPKIILKEDGFYEISFVYPAEKISELVKDSRYGDANNLSYLITKSLADKYVTENYASLAKLIDLDTVKLLATRRLAGIVAKEGHND